VAKNATWLRARDGRKIYLARQNYYKGISAWNKAGHQSLQKEGESREAQKQKEGERKKVRGGGAAKNEPRRFREERADAVT